MGTAISRRVVIAALSAAALTARTHAAVGRTPVAPRRSPLIINALGDIADPNPDAVKQAAPPNSRDTGVDSRGLADARASGLTAVNVTLGYVSGDDDPYESSIRDIARWQGFVASNPRALRRVLTAGDIIEARATGQLGIIAGFQNTAMLGTHLDRIGLFADLGVRVIQLTYNGRNLVGDGCNVSDDQGLKPFGLEVVRGLNQARVLMDLSHSSRETCLAAARESVVPVSITHTGCRALVDFPRNKADDELRLVATRGGVVGIYFMPFLRLDGAPTADDVVRHCLHALDVCGEDHVGVGTDGSVAQVDDLNRYRVEYRRTVLSRRAAGIGAQGENENTYQFVIDLRGPTQFHRLADRLQRQGCRSRIIDKVLGENFLRLFREVW